MDNVKIFIFESLNEDDELTGSALFSDLESESQMIPNTNLFLFNNIINEDAFYEYLKKVKDTVSYEDTVFVHFEMHGLSDGQGLRLKNGDICYYKDICKSCLEINKKLGCRLYLTLAVCHGLWMLSGIVKDMSFCGIIGSHEEIYESDLKVRYKIFYDSLILGHGDIDYAMDELHKANTNLPDTYQYIKLEEIFIDAFKATLKRFNSAEWRTQNTKMVSIENHFNRRQRRDFERKSKKHEKNTRVFYKKLVDDVFMLNEFPDNKTRFKIPKYDELK